MTVDNTVTVDAFLSNPGHPAVIADIALHIADNIGQLQAKQAKIISITLTDQTPVLSVTANQYSSDALVLAKISNSGAWLTISGVTAANALTMLRKPHVLSVSVTDSTANILSNLTTSKLQGNPDVTAFTIKDSAIALQNGLDKLQLAVSALGTASKLVGINLTNPGTPSLTVTATQLTNDIGVLNLIDSPYSLTVNKVAASNVSSVLANNHVGSVTVTDSLANLTASLDNLENNGYGAKITSITLTDKPLPIPSQPFTIAQFANDIDLLQKISSNYKLTLTGTAADLSHNISLLQSHLGKINAITLSDQAPLIAITNQQYTADSGVLNQIKNSYDLSITGVAVENAASMLAKNHVISITVTDTAANILHNLKAGGLQGNSSVLALSINDTAANLQTNLDKLQTANQQLGNTSKLDSISLKNQQVPTLSLTVAQMISDNPILSLINSPYNLVLTGVNADNLQTVLNTANVISTAVADSATHIAAIFDQLQILASGNKLISITLTDNPPAPLQLTNAQFLNDTKALAKISGAYSLSISGILANQVTATLANNHVGSVYVSDLAMNVSNNLDTLESKVNKIGGITLSDTSSPTLTLTAAQLTTDQAVLNKITNLNYKQNISDTAAHVQSNLASLEANASKISSISLTDISKPTLTLTAEQLTLDADAIKLISTPYLIKTSGFVSLLQDYLIQQNYSGLPDNTPLVTTDSLFGLEQSTAAPHSVVVVADDFSHLVYSTQANSLPILNSSAISAALNGGKVWWADSLSKLTNNDMQNTLQNTMQVSALTGILVVDSVADYKNHFNADKTALLNLLTKFNVSKADIGLILADNLSNLQTTNGGLVATGQHLLQLYPTNTGVDVLDNIAHLESAYANGMLSKLNQAVEKLIIHAISITATDTIANLDAILNDVSKKGLYQQFQNISVVDSAANIEHGLQNPVTGNNALTLANSITINDSFDNVQTALQNYPSLLGQVSLVQLTSLGSGALQIQAIGSGNTVSIAALPEFDLSKIMSGALSATETEMTNQGGININITDKQHHSLSIDLVGVIDASLNTYTHGGWYHA